MSKKRRTIDEIVEELQDETRRQLAALMECNKELQNHELSALKRIELSAKILEIWRELRQMHMMIRESNKSSIPFFDDLDEKLKLYEEKEKENK